MPTARRVTTEKALCHRHSTEALTFVGILRRLEAADPLRSRRRHARAPRQITDHWGVAKLLSLAQQLGLVTCLGCSQRNDKESPHDQCRSAESRTASANAEKGMH